MPTPRLRRLLAGATVLFGGAILFRFPPERFPFYPPCPIHQMLGLQCPGCGSTRALSALLHAHLRDAWHHNALFVLLLPFGLVFLGSALARSGPEGEPRWPRLPAPILPLLLLVTVCFTIARNVP